ncbi:substrate-binding periplasmic protein [Burkholderiaceae bacterium UC74_6]
MSTSLLRFPRRWLVAVAALLAVGQFGAAQADATRWQFVTEQFAPYTLARGGEAAGPMVDVLRRVCEKLRVDCNVEVLPWRRALRMAERGEVEGIFTVVDTPERRAAFWLADPVIEARYTFFARADNAFAYTAPRDLREQTIGVYGPSASSTILSGLLKEGNARMVVEVDNTTVLRKLAGGRYGDDGLAMVNEMVAREIIAHEHMTGLRAVGEASRFTYTFGLSRQRLQAADLARFNEALTQLCRSGELQRLLDPYGMRSPSCRG